MLWKITFFFRVTRACLKNNLEAEYRKFHHYLLFIYSGIFVMNQCIISGWFHLTLSWRRPLLANQWTGFYRITASNTKALNTKTCLVINEYYYLRALTKTFLIFLAIFVFSFFANINIEELICIFWCGDLMLLKMKEFVLMKEFCYRLNLNW